MPVIVTKQVGEALRSAAKAPATLFHGDSSRLIPALKSDSLSLTITSPPYCMGKEYESSRDVAAFIEAHRALLPEVVRATKPGGSICWQVGNYVKNGEVVPLDALVYEIMRGISGVKLRNRIVWTFGHGLHCRNRFSGRHETLLWFTKDGAPHHFDLDAVRVPQKYPGKIYNKGPRKGEYSGNPLGKNPGDVWDIPNVKSNHVEKTGHPCQFPVALVQRLVRALTRPTELVFDPFSGVASAGVATLIEGRRFLGAEISAKYLGAAKRRLESAVMGSAQIRPLEQDVRVPRAQEKVSKRPEHFRFTNLDAQP